MTTPGDINRYGGVFEDEKPVQNPKTQQSAAYFNRMSEDTAQMTRTSTKARVTFVPVAAAAPQTLNPLAITVASHYGNGTPQKPVITKTGTGAYTITFPTAFFDALGVSEDVSFLDAQASVRGATHGDAQVVSVAGNVIAVNIYNSAGALADLTADTVVVRAE